MSISSTLVQGADIRFQEAAHVLRPYVGCFWVITAGQGAVIRTVPDSTAAISIHLQNERRTEWSLRGPLLRPSERRFESTATLVGVLLRPGVAYLLTGIHADSLVDRRVALSSINAFQQLVWSKAGPRSPEDYIVALERFLIDRLRNSTVHESVSAAIREIERSHGCARVSDVAAQCRISSRHLNRLMRVWVGYGAKRFATIVRLQAVLHQMDQSPRSSAALLASQTGYFDQSHLTSDASRFTGATPGHLSSSCVADFSKTRCDDLP